MLTCFAHCQVNIQDSSIGTKDFLKMVSVDILCDLFYNNLPIMLDETP